MGYLQSFFPDIFVLRHYLEEDWPGAGGIGRGRLYISQTCANMLSTYDLACKVPLLVLMLVCVRAGFCFKLGWVREPELEFVLADLNVVVI